MSSPQPSDQPERLVPVAEAAAILGVHVATVYRRASQGRIAMVRSGAKTFVWESELARYQQENVKPFVPGERVIADAGGKRPATAAHHRTAG